MFTKLILISVLLIGSSVAQEDLDILIGSIFNTSAGTPDTRDKLPPFVINPVPQEVTDRPVTQKPSTPAPIPLTPVGGHSYKPCGLGMECVREYLCANGKVNSDGATLIDIRLDDQASCPFLETCCATGDKVEEPIIRPVDPKSGCGYRNVEGVGFKIQGSGDNEAQFAEFNWVCAILRTEMALGQQLNVYQCGGALITPSVILTAAHCVQARQASNFKVRAGEWETNTKTELYPDQDRQVVEMIIHPNYNKGSLYNDVAMLIVDKPFELAPNVGTICLPPATQNFDMSRCFATGWGKDQFQNGQYQNILKKIDLPVVPNAKCQEDLRKTRLGKFFELHSSFMCAGGERGKDTCKGDGGSPLVCPIADQPNRFYQAGIVAWGIGCGDENVPGVYASVAHLRSWIDEELANRKIDSAPFTA